MEKNELAVLKRKVRKLEAQVDRLADFAVTLAIGIKTYENIAGGIQLPTYFSEFPRTVKAYNLDKGGVQ